MNPGQIPPVRRHAQRLSKRWRALLAAAFAIASVTALSGCVDAAYPVSAVNAKALAVKPLPTKPVSYLGVHEADIPQSYALTSTFAKTIGRWPNVVLYYSGWPEQFQTTFATTARSHGAVTLVDLDPTHTPLQSIIDGKQDAYLRSYAQSVRAFGHPVLISFAHEMNGHWYKWGSGHTRPKVWIEAWRHIVNLFRKQGATNVTWVWTVNAVWPGARPIRDWWPGKSYVNWVGVDGYIYRRSNNFQNTFGATLRQIRKLTNKPVFISETAVGQVAGQASKIPNLIASVKRDNLLGFLWFDKGQNRGLRHQDWRLEGDRAGVNALRRSLKRYFHPLVNIKRY